VNLGCWEYLGCRDRDGYGQFQLGNKSKKAHRFSYEYYHGFIDSSLTVDHLCRNRACCNPTHLQQISIKENVFHGISFSAINLRKTHCFNGHPFSGKNLLITNNRRVCRICSRHNNQRYRERKILA